MIRDDKEISSRLNLFYKEIFDEYEKLTPKNIENLKILIDSIFSSLRPTMYKKEEYKEQINRYLYPEISLVGLTKLYSYDKYIQYSFLIKVNNFIKNELEKNEEKINIKRK